MANIPMSTFSRLINNRKSPSKYEAILLREALVGNGVMSLKEFHAAIEKNEEVLEAANRKNKCSKKRA